jgi:Tol biopolymer transport system component
LSDFGFNPSWSPDGKRIVVASERTELHPRSRARSSSLWIIDITTSARRAITETPAGTGFAAAGKDAVQPSWSPGGRRVAFWGLADSVGTRDLWTIEPDAPRPSETLVRVTSDRALDWNPVWSPDGKYLYFGSDRDGTMNLWRIELDEETSEPAGPPEPLSLPAMFAGHFAVSSQGHLAFATSTRSYRLVALPFDPKTATTGEPRTILEGSLEAMSFDGSPDGRSVAFTIGGAQEDLFTVEADGTHLRQLTNDEARDRGVVWSHDGKLLYLYGNRDGAYHIWRIGNDGGGLTRVTTDLDLQRAGAKFLFGRPDISPDGRTLAVQSDVGAGVIHLDRAPGQRYEPLRGDGELSFPSWSPDGKRLLGVRRDRSGVPAPGVFSYSLATRRHETVSERGHSPQWLPGGKIVFFEKNAIGVVDVDTRAVISAPFKPLPGVRLDDTIIYPRISRDGRMLYLRQVLEQGDIWMVRTAKDAG